MSSIPEIGSGLPPRAAEVEPPAAVLHAGGSSETDMGVTGNAIILLGFIAGAIDARAPDAWYDLEFVDVHAGFQVLRHSVTGNTFRVSVVQLEGTV